MEENEEPEDIYLNYLAYMEEPSPSHPNGVTPWNKENGAIASLYRCETVDAKGLYIFDSFYKLQRNDEYDIGGVYNDGEPGLWFYFTTTTCPGYNYLMNIFVCQRNPGVFTLGISNSNTLSTSSSNGDKVTTLPNDLVWLQFNSTQTDSIHYVKTFCFTDQNRLSLQNTVLVIPLTIEMSARCLLNKNVVQAIKVEHEFGKELLKDQEPDFILTSESGEEYKVHKIALAAHSPVIRDAIRDKDCNTYHLNTSDKIIDLLLQYMYTGTIKNILHENYETLLDMAENFQLKNLLVQINLAIMMSINSDNALKIAVIAEKYNYDEIQEVAFKYIEKHPEILESDAFAEIDNASLVKKLLKYIHVKNSKH